MGRVQGGRTSDRERWVIDALLLVCLLATVAMLIATPAFDAALKVSCVWIRSLSFQ